MNCEDFEALLADVLGGELSGTDRSAFEKHANECERCRDEYDSLRLAVDRMRTLSGPRRVTINHGHNPKISGSAPGGMARGLRLLSKGVFRYAASVLIAFVAGYALHAGLMIGAATSERATLVQDDAQTFGHTSMTSSAHSATPTTLIRVDNRLKHALINAHERNPTRSDLAKCLMAVLASSG